MAATSKGYSLRVSDVSWILGVVSAIASERKKRTACFDRNDSGRLDCESVYKASNREYILALGLRKSFGGMGCDVGLMENAIIEARSVGWKCVEVDIIPIAEENLVASLYLSIDEWELAAIDFHVSNIIEQWRFELMVEDQEVEDNFLSSVMWQYSSGVSRKIGSEVEIVDPEMLVFWTRYEGIVRRLQRDILVNGK